MSEAISERVKQEALQRQALPKPMSEKASDLTPPNLPTNKDDCPQANPGILLSDISGTVSCSGPQNRDVRLRRLEKSEEDLWRGAPSTLRRHGSQLVPGSVEGIDLVAKLIEKPGALMAKPDSCTPEIHNAYLEAQRMARSDASFKARRLDRHVRGVIRSLCPRKNDGS